MLHFLLFTGPPIITSHPVNRVANTTVGVTFSCKTTGKKPITYKWEASSIDGEQWETLQGSDGESLSIRNVKKSEKYRCIASNEAGSTTSNASSVIFMSKLLYQQWYI